MPGQEAILRAQQDGRWCFGCAQERDDVEERYSFGVYAGKLCVPCCMKYRDHCGIDQDQGLPSDLEELGEVYYQEDY